MQLWTTVALTLSVDAGLAIHRGVKDKLRRDIPLEYIVIFNGKAVGISDQSISNGGFKTETVVCWYKHTKSWERTSGVASGRAPRNMLKTIAAHSPI